MREPAAAPAQRRRRWRAPVEARWSVRLDAVDTGTWERAVAEAERAYGTGIQERTRDGRRWIGARAHPLVVLSAHGTIAAATLEVLVTRPPGRPWVAALTWLCLPMAFVVAVVLLARPSAGAEWLVAAVLGGVPIAAGLVAWTLAWARHARAWRVTRPVLAVQAAVHRPDAVHGAARPGPLPFDDDIEPSEARLPEAVGPAEWLSQDEVEGLLEAMPARVAPEDLRRARRVVVRTTVERRPSHLLPDGFTEWRPRKTP